MNSKTGPQFRNFMNSMIVLSALAIGQRLEAREITYSSSVPAKLSTQLKTDLDRQVSMVDDEPDLKKIMGVSDLRPQTLHQWLVDRVGFIIGEGEDISAGLTVLQNDYVYQNPGVLPDFEAPAPQPPEPAASPSPNPTESVPTKPLFVMTNYGTNFYYHGKQNRQLMGYSFNGQTIPVTSPRTGIIQIGHGLFAKLINEEDPTAVANSIYRLAVLFHEAHHSDGNGRSLGFPHVLCPKESPYHSLPSCDREANGPYALGAHFIREAVIACLNERTCTEEEAETLGVIAVDYRDRVLSTDINWDPAPEGL